MMLLSRYSGRICFTALLALLSSQAQANLILNGDFEQGNQDFASQLYAHQPGDGILANGEYRVGRNPNSFNEFFSSFGDHTTGSGLMMIVNASDVAETVVWSQTVSVTANTVYDFSAFATSVFPNSPANLMFVAGSESLGTLQLSSNNPNWLNFTAQYTAQTTGDVELRIYDLVTVRNGNDFALDDISLIEAVPEPSTMVMWCVLGLIGVGVWRRKRRTS